MSNKKTLPLREINTGYFKDNTLISDKSGNKKNWKDVLKENPDYEIYVDDNGKPIFNQKELNKSDGTPNINPFQYMSNPNYLRASQGYRDYIKNSSSGMEILNAMSLGLLNRLSLSQNVGSIRDIKRFANGEITGNQLAKSIVDGNTGFLSEESYNKDPITGEVINIAGDAIIPGIMFPKVSHITNPSIKSLYHSNSTTGQYLRFIGGKFKYGFDARLPDLIRRTQNPMPKKYIMRRNSPIIISPLENRFIFKSTGTPNPVITNFTTDLPVIPNNGGTWNGFDINIISGNQLLGKNVISTKPMDTFTYGDKIVVPKRAFKTISSQHGTIPEEQLMTEFFKIYRRPTLKDYQFMDYVFQPKYQSEVIINTPITIQNASTHPLGKYLSDGDMRSRIKQPWESVMYDIAPTAESEFRNKLGIILKYKK